MVSIGKMRSGGEGYYLGKVAEGAEDYYSGEGEAEGYWLGDGAGDLGLQGKVDGDQLVAMLTGRDPMSGVPFGLKAPPSGEPIPGFDLTFSAPKSVSLIWALGGHPVSGEVKAAHAAAVAEGLAYLEQNACWVRRGGGGHEFHRGKGFLAAAYPHRSSRNGDPQLHTHVLIANATLGPDGRWSRLYHPALYEHTKTASYIYEAHLRHELSLRLGVEWESVRKGIADIKGFSAEQLRHFSTRREEILAAVGPDASARSMQVATLATRTAKERDLSESTLRETWRVKALEVGLDHELIAGFPARAQPGRTLLTAEQVARTVTAHASHFDRRAAIQAVADNLPHGAPASEVVGVADAFLASESVIRIAETPRGDRFTTTRIWELEKRALESAETMAAERGHAVAGELIAARVIAARPSLKADQREMVRRLLVGGEGLTIVIGEAGAGKTYAVVAAASGWAARATELRAAAPTWRGAGALRSEGLQAQSVASLLAELDRAAEHGEAALARGSVLLIDEAGMVDSAALARLIEHARAAEAKLVLIGDPAQLGEIEAGGLFAALAGRHDPVVLDEVIRHRHELDREGAKRIREGEGAEALAVYRSEGRVLAAADPEARREEMVSDWWRSFGAGEEALMVAKRNAEVERLNALAREVMRAEGRLGQEEIEVGGVQFAAGDQVITRVNDHRAQIYNRERWRVESVDADAQAVVLDGIDTRRRVCVDSVYLGRVNESDGAPALQHAYAATTYQAQGATVDRAFVVADASMNRQELYVAASRSREETYFYATPEVGTEREEYAPGEPSLYRGLQHIAAAAERDGAQLAAHEEALRSPLAKLPTAELDRLRERVRLRASREQGAHESHEGNRRWADRNLENTEARIEKLEAERGALLDAPRRERRADRREREAKLDRTGHRLAREHQVAERNRAEIAALPRGVERSARAELAVIDHLIAERERLVLAAFALSPPPYIANELGERPADPDKRERWDGAVKEIERYRERHGFGDKDTAIGQRPAAVQHEQRMDWDRAQRQTREAQRSLGRERSLEISRSLDMGIEL